MESKQSSEKLSSDALITMESKAAYLSVLSSTNDDLTSKKQLLQALQYSGRNPTSKQIENAWKNYSDNEVIEYTNFMKIMREIKMTTKLQLLQAFRKMDINNDGYITHSELYRVMTAKGDKMTHSEVQRIIASVDRSDDGKLDYDEFADLIINTGQKCRQLSIDRLQDSRPRSPLRQSNSRPVSASSTGRQTPRSSRPFTSHDDVIEEDFPSTSVTPKEKKSKSSIFGSIKGSSRPGSAKKNNSRPSSAKKSDIKLTENSVIIKSDAVWQKKCSLAEPKSLKDWNHSFSKGCFFIDEEDDFIVTHQYLLEIPNATHCYITIEPYTLTKLHGAPNNNVQNTTMPNAVDTSLLIIQESRTSYDPPEIVGITEVKKNQQFRWQGDLRSGIYRLIPFTSGCRLQKRQNDPVDEIELVRKDQHGEIQLSRAFKETLSDIFEICDLDGNGLLNRSEFNWFQTVTGDSDTDDEAWAVVEDNFELKKGQLTREGFFQLHQMQAQENNEESLAELEMTVSAMGYNKALDMDQACPFKVQVYTKDCRSRMDVAKLTTQQDATNLDEHLAEYVSKNGDVHNLKSLVDADIIISRTDSRIMAAIENKSSKSIKISTDNKLSRNCLCTDKTVIIQPLSKMVVDKVIPKNEKEEWTYNCTFHNIVSTRNTPKPAERKRPVNKKNPILSIF